MSEGATAKIEPGMPAGNLTIRPGIGGGTSLSMQRRVHDNRFVTRYFVGYGWT